jgi:uncharacterized DUF497 family protein
MPFFVPIGFEGNFELLFSIFSSKQEIIRNLSARSCRFRERVFFGKPF